MISKSTEMFYCCIPKTKHDLQYSRCLKATLICRVMQALAHVAL